MISERPQVELQKPAWFIEATTQELDAFTMPFVPMTAEQQILKRFRDELDIRKPYNTGLVIGRFQPLHYGHIFLMKEALETCKQIIIGIGSSNNSGDMNNPWGPFTRYKRIQRTIDSLGIRDRIQNVVFLKDFHNDKAWLKEIAHKAGNVEVSIGNNEWVNGIFESVDFPVIRTPEYHRGQLEGKTIRAKLRSRIRSNEYC